MGRFLPSFALYALALIASASGSGSSTDAAPDTPRPVDAAIDGNNCSAQPCSILPQCGCGATQACDVDTSDSMGGACRSVLVEGRETATCAALDRCDKGYVCLGGASASCKKYCMADGDCGTPRGRCAIDISSGGKPVVGIPSACSSNCNPLLTTAPSECPANYKCGLFTATHAGAPVKIAECTPAGTGTQGANCKQGSAGNEALCARGYLCTSVDNGANFACRRICNRTANTGCAGGQNCLSFAPAHTIDIEYGVCNG